MFGWPHGPVTAKMSAMGVEEALERAVANFGLSVRNKLWPSASLGSRKINCALLSNA